MMIDDLRRRWREAKAFSPFRPLYALIEIAKGWLVLGENTVLARRTYNHWGEPDLVFKGGQERVLTLLALAYMRPMPARVLDHLRRAARDWGRGEKCLADILAFGHLGKLHDPRKPPSACSWPTGQSRRQFLAKVPNAAFRIQGGPPRREPRVAHAQTKTRDRRKQSSSYSNSVPLRASTSPAR
jgi:hypothetical protein